MNDNTDLAIKPNDKAQPNGESDRDQSTAVPDESRPHMFAGNTWGLSLEPDPNGSLFSIEEAEESRRILAKWSTPRVDGETGSSGDGSSGSKKTIAETAAELANKILGKYHIVTFPRRPEEILVYSNGVYKEGGEQIIAEAIEKNLDDNPEPQASQSVTTHLNQRSSRPCEKTHI